MSTLSSAGHFIAIFCFTDYICKNKNRMKGIIFSCLLPVDKQLSHAFCSVASKVKRRQMVQDVNCAVDLKWFQRLNRVPTLLRQPI